MLRPHPRAFSPNLSVTCNADPLKSAQQASPCDGGVLWPLLLHRYSVNNSFGIE